MRCCPQRSISPRRWSSMSDRAYACVTAFPSSWARASSLAAQSAPFSSAQERKVALNPCSVVSSPAVRNASAIVLWWMIRPRRDGNTRSSDAGSVRASSSTARAAVESGTRCDLRIFVRSVGTVHSASSTSISDQRAPRVSLERVAVRMANRMARAAGVSRASRAARAAGASWGGVEAKCRTGGFRLGRTPSRTSPAGLVCRYPWATIQAPIRLRRCLRLRASLGFEFQRGSRMLRT